MPETLSYQITLNCPIGADVRHIDLDRSTLAGWIGKAAYELRPVFDALIADLKGSSKLFMDETRAPVLEPGKRKTKTGYFWALARDDRPWGGAAPPGVAFTYAPGRSGQYADDILKGFSGILQVDGYAGYNRLLKRADDSVALAYCWAHARRKLHEVAQSGTAPIAKEGLKQIAALYRIEKDIRDLAAEARLAARQERSVPLIAAFEAWVTAHRARVSTKAPLGEALRYIAKYWSGLVLFLDDGRIEMDSNAVERTMRPIALNRKNALFAGHDAGAANWGVIASLIETCKHNAVDPHAYLAETLTAIVNGHKQSDIDALLPWNYNRLRQKGTVMSIIEIKVTLEYIEPAVTRNLQVPSDIRLDRLHLTLQAAMGWTNSHLYMFEAEGVTWGLPDPDFGGDDLPANKTTLAEVLTDTGARSIRYIYDFGDSWEHRLQIGEITDPNLGDLYPRLTDISGRCPPEDVGGFPGYEEFLDAMADAKHPEHASLKEWYGGSFDPSTPPADELRFEVLKLAKRWKPKKRPTDRRGIRAPLTQ